MDIRTISPKNREQVNKFIRDQWFTTEMAVRGKIVDMAQLDGVVAYERETIIGLITYKIEGNECEVMSLDSIREKHGIGTTLLNEVIKISSIMKCSKVKLITTNDNINAIKFYQKRGFDMVHLYYDAVKEARKLKSSIPVIGDFGIPLRHEIEFEIKVDQK
ncbi:MAG: GNAT family N-acetyltransferase [Clostridium sp.]|nr:GNAT family N-acetyltransferase [Clostridium sp.]